MIEEPAPNVGPAWDAGHVGALTARLLQLTHLLRQSLAGTLRGSVAGRGLAPFQLMILIGVRRRGRVRLSDISQQAGIPPSTITGMVDRLEQAKLLRRRRDRMDRRAVLIELTPAGTGLIDELEADLERSLRPRLAEVPPGLASRITEDLGRLIEALQATAPAPGVRE